MSRAPRHAWEPIVARACLRRAYLRRVCLQRACLRRIRRQRRADDLHGMNAGPQLVARMQDIACRSCEISWAFCASSCRFLFAYVAVVHPGAQRRSPSTSPRRYAPVSGLAGKDCMQTRDGGRRMYQPIDLIDIQDRNESCLAATRVRPRKHSGRSASAARLLSSPRPTRDAGPSRDPVLPSLQPLRMGGIGLHKRTRAGFIQAVDKEHGLPSTAGRPTGPRRSSFLPVL